MTDLLTPGIDAPQRTGMVIVAVGIALVARSIDLAVYLRAANDLLAGRDVNVTPAGELPWLYPPAAALPFVPLTWLPFDLAAALWALVSMAALARVVQLVLRGLRQAQAPVWAVVAAALLAEPVTSTLGYGQVNLVVAWLVTEGFLGRRRWLVGVAAGIKLTPLVFLLPLILRRDFRGATQALGGFAATVAVGWLLAPAASTTYWSGLFFNPSDRIGIAYPANQSINGALWRAAGEGGVPLLHVALAVAVLALTVAILRRNPGDAVLALWVCGLAGLLVSPISWIHHWVWLIPALLWLWAHGRRRLALVWGVLLVTRLTWWLPGFDSAWAVAALVTLTLLSTSQAGGSGGGTTPIWRIAPSSSRTPQCSASRSPSVR